MFKLFNLILRFKKWVRVSSKLTARSSNKQVNLPKIVKAEGLKMMTLTLMISGMSVDWPYEDNIFPQEFRADQPLISSDYAEYALVPKEVIFKEEDYLPYEINHIVAKVCFIGMAMVLLHYVITGHLPFLGESLLNREAILDREEAMEDARYQKYIESNSNSSAISSDIRLGYQADVELPYQLQASHHFAYSSINITDVIKRTMTDIERSIELWTVASPMVSDMRSASIGYLKEILFNKTEVEPVQYGAYHYFWRLIDNRIKLCCRHMLVKDNDSFNIAFIDRLSVETQWTLANRLRQASHQLSEDI